MSLDIVELIIAIEDEFKLSIPNKEAAQLITVGKVYNYVLTQISEPGLTLNDCQQQDIWKRVKRIVIKQAGVKPEEVTMEASFIEDLGLD